MRRLDALVHRRRRLVLAALAVVLLAALPPAAHQSNHLTGGGFGVPGSQSDRVEKAVAADFDRTKAATLGAVLVPGRGARAGGMRPALDRRGRPAAAAPDVALTAPARRAAERQLARDGARPLV